MVNCPNAVAAPDAPMPDGTIVTQHGCALLSTIAGRPNWHVVDSACAVVCAGDVPGSVCAFSINAALAERVYAHSEQPDSCPSCGLLLSLADAFALFAERMGSAEAEKLLVRAVSYGMSESQAEALAAANNIPWSD
jgi:hypothetical protein